MNAVDPDGDVLNYEYSTTEGTISGKSRLVVWDLDNVKRGPHEVRVIVTDGRGGKVEAALRVITVDSSTCDPPPPPCPEIKVSCPDELEESKPFKFSALIIEGKAEKDEILSFHWKLNAGRLVKGQDSFEIEATTTGANGSDNITATVEVGGFHPALLRLQVAPRRFCERQINASARWRARRPCRIEQFPNKIGGTFVAQHRALVQVEEP